ncbi:MAG: hypothetical protein GC131_02905 [Alphaproteobacteria bacterium]|nr:hypothetical protein [Alphaproteobacteria bacterium]
MKGMKAKIMALAAAALELGGPRAAAQEPGADTRPVCTLAVDTRGARETGLAAYDDRTMPVIQEGSLVAIGLRAALGEQASGLVTSGRCAEVTVVSRHGNPLAIAGFDAIGYGAEPVRSGIEAERRANLDAGGPGTGPR